MNQQNKSKLIRTKYKLKETNCNDEAPQFLRCYDGNAQDKKYNFPTKCKRTEAF